MSRTANVFARIEPEIKEQAEDVLGQLGIPMSNAIGLFLRQVVLQRGIPFEMKLPSKKPLALGMLSEAEFNAEIEKGFADIAAGRVRPADEVFAEIQRDYGL
ncbi:MAG: type II toxin-antitoxin system RelB/DinJ family antitoxin [Coriobacteriia bacterium]|nr:type II toxin-antitoxin system RelB/DinJ family antitoxin [Coriobacteriia bacterium]